MAARADLLPFYALCDTSASMRDGGRIEALNDVIAATRDATVIDPLVANRIRVGIVSFAGSASVVLPLCHLGRRDSIPTLAPQGLTRYAPAFDLLRLTIEHDVAQLEADGYRALRPAVFFLTDGRPTDPAATWRASLWRLLADDFPHRPNIVAFGIGEAAAEVLAEVGTVASYVAADAASGAAAIGAFGTVLVESVVASGAAGGLRLPATTPVSLADAAPAGDLL